MPVIPDIRAAASAAGTLAALLLAGCASDPLAHAPPAAGRPWQPSVAAGGEIVPGPAATATPPAEGFVLPANEQLAVLPPAPAIDPDKRYELADLIDLAQSNSPRTRIAWNAAREAALAAGLARSSFLPRISATALGGYRTSDRRSTALGNSDANDASAWGGTAVLSLQWLLFDFGERKAVVEGADQLTVAADIEFTAAHQRLIHDVSLAYFAYSDVRARLAIAEQSLADAEAVERAAGARFASGVGTIIETAQAKQASAQARLARVEAGGAVKTAYAELLSAMGLPPFVKIEVAQSVPRPLPPTLAGDAEKAVAGAFSRRPDILAAFAVLKSREAGERAASAAFLPKVFVSGNTSYAAGDVRLSGLPAIGSGEAPTFNLSDRRLGATILGGVTVPLFDGGARRTALAQARVRAETARATLDEVGQQAAQQVVAAQGRLETSLAAYAAADELQSAAQVAFDAALAAYRSGVGSSTEMLIAERQLLEARILASTAYHAALGAAATLALASGVLGTPPEAGVP